MDDTDVSHGGLSLDDPPECSRSYLTIRRVDCRQKVLAGEGSVTNQTEHRAAMLSGPQFVCGAIELPQPGIHRSGGEYHSLFAFLQRVLGLLPSTPLNQQGGNDHGLKSNDQRCGRNQVLVLFPNAGLMKQNHASRRKIAQLKAPPVHGSCIDAR